MSKLRQLELLKRCTVAFLMLALQAQALAHIAQPTDVGSFEKYLAHAALGCGVGAVRSDSSDGCAPGAAGAVVAHMAADSVKLALVDKDPNAWAQTVNAVPGRTLDEDVVFWSGLAGGAAAALVGDKDALEGNFGLGQSAGENAVKNNYLKFDEAKKLQSLKDQQLKGQCTEKCQADIESLEAADRKRNEELARCEGSSSEECQRAFHAVRLAAAEYVRQEAKWTLAGQTVLNERHETLELARATTDGKLEGAVQGYWEALKDTASSLKDGAQTLFAAVKGDAQAWESIKSGAGTAVDYVSEPENWPYLLGAMTPEEREQLAKAYESGNGTEIGRLMAQEVANMPLGGGPMGSIKKIDEVIEAARKQDTGLSQGANGGAAAEVILPGMNRPVRPINADFPPNQAVVDAVNSPEIQAWVKNTGCIDCSEIAPKLLQAAGGKGQILEVQPTNRGSLNVLENGDMKAGQSYHQVYTDGKYVYDPRLSSQPIPKGDWEQHIRNINPGGVNISTDLKGLQ